MKRVVLFICMVCVCVFVTHAVFAKATIKRAVNKTTNTQKTVSDSTAVQRQNPDQSQTENIVVKEEQNLPESYYNSLKPLAADTTSTKEVKVVTLSDEEPQTVPVKAEEKKVVEETAPQEVAKEEPVVPEPAPQPAPQPKKKRAPPIDYNYGYNTSYFATELGKIRAELEALKTGINTTNHAGYDGGFFIKSDDGKFLFNINGILQFRYALNIAEDVEDGHTFRLRRLRITFSGNAFSEKFVYFIMLNPPSDFGLAAFEVGYQFHPAFHFFASQGPILPNTGTFPSSSGRMTISAPMSNSRFLYGNGLGVYATGGIGWFNYSVGVVNGMNLDYGVSKTNEMFYLSRFDINILGKVGSVEGDLEYHETPAMAFGFGGAFGHDDEGTQSRIIGGAADFAFKYKGFALRGGGDYRQIDPDQFTRAQTDTSAMLAVSYFVVPKKVELALRGNALFDDLTNAGLNMYMAPFGSPGDTSWGGGPLSGGDVDGDSANEYAGSFCLGYYFNNSKNSKIQAEYTLFYDSLDTSVDTRIYHVGQLQVQLGF